MDVANIIFIFVLSVIFLVIPLGILTWWYLRKKEFSFLSAAAFALLSCAPFFFLNFLLLAVFGNIYGEFVGLAALFLAFVAAIFFFIFSLVSLFIMRFNLGTITIKDLLVIIVGNIPFPLSAITIIILFQFKHLHTIWWLPIIIALIAQAIFWTWWFYDRKKYLGIMLTGIFALAAVIGHVPMRNWLFSYAYLVI